MYKQTQKQKYSFVLDICNRLSKFKEIKSIIQNSIFNRPNKYEYLQYQFEHDIENPIITTIIKCTCSLQLYHFYTEEIITKKHQKIETNFTINNLIIEPINFIEKEKKKKIKIKKVKDININNEQTTENILNNFNHQKFCVCTGDNIDVYSYIYSLISCTNKNIFKLTKLIRDKNNNKTDNFPTCHHNNLISIISKYKLQFKEFIINTYGLDNYKKIFQKIRITKFLISKYKNYIEYYEFDLLNHTMKDCIYLRNNIYFNKIKNNIYDCLNVQLSEISVLNTLNYSLTKKSKPKIKHQINNNSNLYYRYNYLSFKKNETHQIKKIFEKFPQYLFELFKHFIKMTRKQSNKDLHDYILSILNEV